MTATLLDREAKPAGERAGERAGRTPGLGLMILGRIACDEGATRPELARELGAILGSGVPIRIAIDAALAQLVRGGHAIEHRSRFTASPSGVARLLAELSIKALPKTWSDLRDVRLVALALGIEREAAARLKAIARPDVLRAEILAEAYGVKVKGPPSPIKLRAALSLVALERAFGNRIKSELTTGAALNAKASRVLAGQLLKRPRDAGTDKRLVALLAAEAVDSAKLDAESLRAGLLRRLAARGAQRLPSATPDMAPSLDAAEVVVAPPPARSSRPPAANRPDLAGFVAVVKSTAAAHAEGWPGNRKALVSRVFRAIADAHPGWGLTLVELKAMLAECHRLGHIVLATADLKDKRLLDELRQSAIAYKNTVWHLIRVED